MNKPVVLVIFPLQFGCDYIKKTASHINIHVIKCAYDGFPAEEDLDKIKHVDICYGNHLLFEKIFKRYPEIKWFHSINGGNEKAMEYLQKLKPAERPIYTRTNGVYNVGVSQFILSHILCHEKHILEMYENQKKRIWVGDVLKSTPHRSLEDLDVGILGLGIIGKTAAKLCSSFNIKIWALVNKEVACEHVNNYVYSVDRLLENCDYIINCLPSTPKTKGLLSGDVLSKCKKKPVLINVGRDDIIDEDSVITALSNGWISKAILDLFKVEPLPSTSRLWDTRGVIISPHMAFGSYPPSDQKKLIAIFLQNYQLYLKKEDLPNQITVQNWY